MNIYDALRDTQYIFREYFKYLHPELRFNTDKPQRTKEEFLKLVHRKSMMPFYRWEKSPEYKRLLMLYLDYRVSNDYEEIYNVVVNKAKETGDPQAVKLFLQLQKDISQNSKMSAKPFVAKKENKVQRIEKVEDEDNELDLT